MIQAHPEPRKITGWHVVAVFVASFGLIIAVNILMAYKAISTFPGLEVKNSYIASQQFDKKRAAQQALRWTAEVQYADGQMILSIKDQSGVSVQADTLSVLVGRTTTVQHDIFPDFIFDGERYRTNLRLAAGAWLVKLDAVSVDGVTFEQRLDLYIKD